MRPLEAADLLSVSLIARDVVLGHADIVIENVAIATARADQVLIPSQGTDARHVTAHTAQLFAALDVPDLNVVVICANSQESTILRPRQRTDIVIFFLKGDQLLLVISWAL